MNEVISAEAYARASSYAPPNFAGRLSGSVSDGYWVDERRYFFCVGEQAPDGTIADQPKIADAVTGAIRPALSGDARDAIAAAAGGRLGDPAAWAKARYDMPDAGTMVVTVGDLAYSVAPDGSGSVAVEPIDPLPMLYSPDGRFAAYLREHTVWVKDRTTGASRQLAPDGERHHAYGTLSEYGVVPLTARRPGAPQGLWSPDSQWLVVQRVDERHLREGGFVEHVPAGGGLAVPHLFKVAPPEDELPTLEYVACNVADGRIVTSAGRPMPACNARGAFTTRECWFAGDAVYFLHWDRFSSHVELVEMRLDTGAIRTVLREAVASGWVNILPFDGEQPLVRVLPQSGELIWYSEQDDLGHLYLHDLATGALKNRITHGDWIVRDIVHVDEAQRRILLLASGFAGDPGRRQACIIGFDGRDFTHQAIDGDVSVRSDPVSGVHQARPFRPSYAANGAAPDGRHVVAAVGEVERGTRNLLIDIRTGAEVELTRTNVDMLWTAPPPEPFELLADDGVTPLIGALYRPTDFDPETSYPLVVYVYPGPQVGAYARRLPNFSSLFLQSIVELGAIGIILETRGLPGRSRSFNQAGDGLTHEPQLVDHVAAIEELCRRHAFIDPERVGIFGSSAGGYAAARALFDYPQTFKVGVSIAGMHDMRNFISYWADRYGPPPGSPRRVEQSNIPVAHKLQGKLCLIQGDMDENVHLAHTLALVDALIDAEKWFELLIVPGAGHGVMIESPYAYQRMIDFFARHLLDAEPPASPALRWTPADLATAHRALAGVA